jgi:hypothetical protein
LVTGRLGWWRAAFGEPPKAAGTKAAADLKSLSQNRIFIIKTTIKKF